MICTCGDTRPHVIARRCTADGIAVCFWSDGCVSGAMGLNVLARRPRSRWAVSRALQANVLVAGEVELYDWAEVRSLVHAARRALKQLSLQPLSYLRRSMAGERFHYNGGPVVTARHTERAS